MSINGKEIVSVVTLIANEKQINKELVFESLENSLAVSLRKDYGKANLKVSLDRNTGAMTVERYQDIVHDLDYKDESQIKFSEYKKIESKLTIGDVYVTVLPNKDLSRVNAQVFKQVMKQNFKQAERKSAEDYYKDYIGTLFYVVVKKVMKNDALVVLNDETEGLLPLSEVNGYQLKAGSKVRVVLESLDNQKGHQLIFSRSSEKYIRAILSQEIPAIGEENVEIVSVARIKGKRVKVVVRSLIAHVDEMRECIGPKGTRVKEVVSALNGEQVDFVSYDSEIGKYISNIMSPITIERVVIDESDNSFYVIVSEDVYKKYGNMVKNNEELAKQILSKNVFIVTAHEYEKDLINKDEQAVKLFVEELNVDQDLADVLVEEGFDTIEAVAYAPLEVFLDIEGFDEEIAMALRDAAYHSIKQYADSDLTDLKTMRVGYLKTLSAAGIKNREQLAELATDDLLEILTISTKEADSIILEAREIWFV